MQLKLQQQNLADRLKRYRRMCPAAMKTWLSNGGRLNNSLIGHDQTFPRLKYLCRKL
jgi:hypothetical protein